MTIAITAPQKFDFQDLVCLAFMLNFIHIDGACFFAEPKDGEDAELSFSDNGLNRMFEIQVKGSTESVTVDVLASCLAHTPGRIENNTLLERLIADDNRLAILVMSGRCSDATAPYVVSLDWNGVPHDLNFIKLEQAKEFLSAFGNAEIPGDPKSDLKIKRKQHNSSFASSAKTKEVRNALSRLVIVEQLDEKKIEAFCAERFLRDYRIPRDQVGDVIRRLHAALKESKSQRVDAYPRIRKILADATPDPILPVGYVSRGIEANFIDELSRKNVLLLTGVPRVGKSWMARYIAAEFQANGYDVREHGDVEQAERFLVESSEGLRIVILDDPLGGIHPIAEPNRMFLRLKTLIQKLRPQRKLIVAQGSSRLLSTARASDIMSASIVGHNWHDMNELPTAFLVLLWQSLALHFNVPNQLRDYIDEALSNKYLHLEPGSLQYLAANCSDLCGEYTLDQIFRIARQDAADLGGFFDEKGYGQLLSTIAVTTTAQEPIDPTSLAYASGDGGCNLPGKRTASGTSIIFGTSPLPKSLPPSYDAPPTLTDKQEDSLDELERLRLLVRTSGSIGFAHPFYRAAAESLVAGQTIRMANKIVETVQRGLFCLSPLTTRGTAKNLDWVFDKLAPQCEAQLNLVDHAIEGLKSYFPATRDVCFQFLVRHLASLSPDKLEDFPSWISSISSINLHDVLWTNGQAHLPFDAYVSGFDYLIQAHKHLTRDEVATELSLLNDNECNYVSPESASSALTFFASDPKSMTLTMIGRLLSYDEAVLRAEAIRLWLVEERHEDEFILERIFSDSHPSCALAALKGAVLGWSSYKLERREAVLSGLRELAANVVCAAALLDQLVLFNRVEVTGQNPPWAIFEALLPVVMATIPHNAVFIDARLFGVTREAVNVLPAASIVSICDGWIDWLERNTQEGKLPSEFTLGVVDILMRATRSEADLRIGRVERLLTFPGTGALLTFIADLVNAWDDLTDIEQTIVMQRLDSGQSDDLWLQAVALTRSVAPMKIQRKILGSQFTLNDGSEILLTSIPSDLLNAAVHVFTGQPQPLWWLGTHHNGKDVWEPLVERIARLPQHPLFELVWGEIFLYNDGRLVQIVHDIGAAYGKRMLDILIRLKVGWTGNLMPDVWSALLALAVDDNERLRWIDQMAAYAGVILDDLSDLKLWLCEERDYLAMFECLKYDYGLIEMASQASSLLEDENNKEFFSTFLYALEMMLEKAPPRLFGTCDNLRMILNRSNAVTPGLDKALQDCRDRLLRERESAKESLLIPDMPLAGWINP